MTAAKTTSERVEKLRQERQALGLRRRELYAHDDDWPKLQALAAKLQRKRERLSKPCAPRSQGRCSRWRGPRPVEEGEVVMEPRKG